MRHLFYLLTSLLVLLAPASQTTPPATSVYLPLVQTEAAPPVPPADPREAEVYRIPVPAVLELYGGSSPDAVTNADGSICATGTGRYRDTETFGQWVWIVESDGSLHLLTLPFVPSARGQFETWQTATGVERRLIAYHDDGTGLAMYAIRLDACAPS